MTPTKILIVEDEFLLVEILLAKLCKNGYIVCGVADTAQAAMEQAEKETPDLVLMDIVLKGKMDGIEAAEQIRTKLGTPIVYLTAHLDRELLERAKLTEPFGYILKPINERELFAVIELALYKAEKERRLKKSEIIFRTVADYTRDWEFWIDSKNRFLYNSPACRKISGFEPEDFEKNPDLFFEIVHKEDSKRVESRFEKAKRSTKPLKLEYRILTSSGRMKWVGMACTPVAKGAGGRKSFRGTVKDITDAKKTERKIEQKEELEDLCFLAGTTGLEIDDLIANALRRIDLAAKGAWSSNDVATTLSEAENFCRRAKELAKIHAALADRTELKFVESDLAKMIESIVKSAVEGSQVRCETSFEKGLAKVLADKKKMRRALRRIVENAKDSARGGGVIKVCAVNCDQPFLPGNSENESGKGLFVKISIADHDGEGAEKVHEKNFDPGRAFVKEGLDKGAVLGMSVAHGIIKKHDGRMTVAYGPDSGTTVAVYLPVRP